MRPPWKSILNPIRLTEWKRFVEHDPEMEFLGYVERCNPFDKTTVRMPAPGRTAWNTHTMGRVYFEFTHGRLSLSESEDDADLATPEAEQKLKSIASALDGLCLGFKS